MELVLAGVLEREPRPRNEVLHGRGDEHLGSVGQRTDAGADVHTDPSGFPVDRFDLPGMQPGTNLEPEGSHRIDDLLPAPHAAGRTVERREEPISRGVDLGPPVTSDERPNGLMVALEQIPQRGIARCGQPSVWIRRFP